MEKILEPYWWEENSARHHPISEHNLIIQSVFRLAREDINEKIRLTIKMYPHKHGEELASEIIEYLEKEELVEVQER